MTTENLQKMRTLIIDTIAKLEDSCIYLEIASQPIPPSESIGRLTRMEAIGEKSVNEAMHLNTKNRLERLKNALLRVDDGTFGICARCKEEIPLGRLEAVPESLICIPCAEKKKR